MFRTFVAGIALGLIAAAAAAHYVPLYDLDREASIISVQPNGGNAELFRINLPGDRIVAGGNGETGAVPASLAWPGHDALKDARLELFKIRNRNNRVVGVASRVTDTGVAPATEWMLHMPARGTIYVTMQASSADGVRRGVLRAGTREFANRRGTVAERLVAASGDALDDTSGQIELQALLVARDEAGAGDAGEAAP